MQHTSPELVTAPSATYKCRAFQSLVQRMDLGLGENSSLCELSLPVCLYITCISGRFGHKDALGSHVCQDILLHSLLGCQATDADSQNIQCSTRSTGNRHDVEAEL